jgi:LacI family transcriptional regulator
LDCAEVACSSHPNWLWPGIRWLSRPVEPVAGLLGLASPPTAFVVGNNYMTIGAMRALREARLAIAGDVALVAFDDFEWADLFTPRLTTIAQPCREMGASAVRLFLNRLRNPGQPPRSIRLAAQLMHRESCGCSSGSGP